MRRGERRRPLAVRVDLAGCGYRNNGRYWGFHDDDDDSYAVWYGIPYGIIAGAPPHVVAQLTSPRHTKGRHGLHDLSDRATVALILEAAEQGSPCSAVQMISLLRDPRDFATVAVG